VEGTVLVGECELWDIAMLTASSEELEEILKESDEFVFSFAVCQEEREEDGEVARSYYQLACQVLR
jgi:hypothetical protein